MKDTQITDLKTNLVAIRLAIELDHQKKLMALAELENLLGPQESLTIEVQETASTALPIKPASKPLVRHSSRFKPQVLEAARTLREPFTSADLAKAVGLTKKDGGNFIQRWHKKGWVSMESFGKYNRSASFGIHDTPTKRAQGMLKSIHAEIAAKKESLS